MLKVRALSMRADLFGEQEIAARTTERQLQATSGLLDAWGLGGSTETPFASQPSLPTPTSSSTEQLPFAPRSYQQQPGGQHWSTNGWSYSADGFGGGAELGRGGYASGLVAESSLSPTEVSPAQALPYNSVPPSYRSTYAPYPTPLAGSTPAFQPPLPSFAPLNQHNPHPGYQAQGAQHPTTEVQYSRHDSYQREAPVQPAPSAQDLADLAHYPSFTPTPLYGGQPLAPQQSLPYPPTSTTSGFDQLGRPLLALPPQWPQSQVPQLPPQSYYGQQSHFQLQYLAQHQQSLYPANFAPSEPTYEAYESTPVS